MPSSLPSSAPLHLDDHDESVRIAVRALGDMRNGGPHTGLLCNPVLLFSKLLTTSIFFSVFQPSDASSSNSVTASSGPSDDNDAQDFVYRVSQLPIVTSALRVYSQGKASSRVVKVRLRIVPAPTHVHTDLSLVRCRDDGVVHSDHGPPRDRSPTTREPAR